MIKRIALIGSRSLSEPQYIQDAHLFYRVAYRCAELGHIMRSGAALGADLIAETAYRDAISNCVADPSQVEIFIPWTRFQAVRGTNNPLHHLHQIPHDPLLIQQAREMVLSTHPAPERLTEGALKLHSRNMNQVFGLNLQTPIDACICWTPKGLKKGGTASAITLCENNSIPVFNLGIENKQHILEVLGDFFNSHQ